LAVLEASASGIPCIAIADTNIKSQIIHLAIPGNDDSLESLIFYSEVISNFVLLCKFGFALLWCSKIRRSSRLISFEE
jgi:ribosomal protein S2